MPCPKPHAIVIVIMSICITHAKPNCNPPPISSDGGCVSEDTTLSEEAIEAIKSAVIDVTSNQTVTSGEDAKFLIKLDLTDVSETVSIVPYINDCEFTDSDNTDHIKCHHEDDDCEKTKKTECKFSKTSMMDSNTKIQFYLFVSHSHMDSLAVTFFSCPLPSFLFVEEKPSEVSVLDHTINPCHGVSFVFSFTPSDTHLVCHLYDEKSLLYSNKTCNNDTVIPPKFFHNHTGDYTLNVTAKKTVATGPTTTFEVSLGKEAIQIDIKDVSLQVIEHELLAEIILKINHRCPLTIPNFVYPISDCFQYKKFEKLMKDLDKDYVIFNCYVKMREKFCTLKIQDSGGNIISYDKNFSTFYTQKTHFYHVLGYNYTAICELVPGHNAGGCRIVYKQIWNGTFYNSNSTELIQAGSNTVAYGNLNFSDPGVYSVEVYDLGNSNDEPAIRTSLVIDQSTRGLPTVIITTEHTEEAGDNKGAIGAAVLGFFCFVLFVVVTVLIVILIRWRRQMNEMRVRLRTDLNGDNTAVQNTAYESHDPEQIQNVHDEPRDDHLEQDEDGSSHGDNDAQNSYRPSIPQQENAQNERRNDMNPEQGDNEPSQPSIPDPEERHNKTNENAATQNTYQPSISEEALVQNPTSSEQVIPSSVGSIPPMADQNQSVETGNDATRITAQFVQTKNEGDTRSILEKDSLKTTVTYTPTSSLNTSQLHGIKQNFLSPDDSYQTGDLPLVDQSLIKAEYGGNSHAHSENRTSSVPSITDPAHPLLT